MALTIISQPAPLGEVLSAYAPIKYKLEATTIYTNPPIVKAYVYVNGLAFGREQVQPHLTYVVMTGVYGFEFDVSERLKRFMSNTDTFKLSGTEIIQPPANESNDGFAKKCQFYVYFELWEASAIDGRYVNSGTTATSSSLYAINQAANQYSAEGSLSAYTQGAVFKFLTNAPRRQSIGIDDYAYLSLWEKGAFRSAMRVRTYNSAGGLIGFAYKPISLVDGSAFRVRRIAVGTNYIKTLISLTGVAYYVIDLVANYLIDPPTPITETFTFYISESCPSVAVHFLNSFGADEVFRFFNQSSSISTEKQSFQSGTTIYPTASERGVTTLNSKGVRQVVLTAELPTEIMNWLYELQMSPQVFLQYPNTASYVAVTIADASSMPISDEDGGVMQLELVANYSNIDYSQSN